MLVPFAMFGIAPEPLMESVFVVVLYSHERLLLVFGMVPLVAAHAAVAVSITNISVTLRRWRASLNPCCHGQRVGAGFVFVFIVIFRLCLISDAKLYIFF